MAASPRWKLVWITGASSGIGRAVAQQLAESGVSVAISARNAEKLASIEATSQCLFAYPVDVTDLTAMQSVANQIEQDHGPIDLAIFSAGLWRPMTVRNFDAGTIAEAMNVNFNGVMNQISSVLPQMRKRGSGHIAFLSSLVGYRGLPKSIAYGPCKAALINFAESLMPDAKRHGIDVSVINPGFVETPMTRINDFPMPFMISADEAAQKIIRGLEKKKFEIAFPWQLTAILKIARLLPYRLYFYLMRRFIARG